MLASERLLLKDERIDPRVKLFLRELIHLLEPIEKKMIDENIQSLQDITLQPNLTRLQMIDYVNNELIKYGKFFQQEFKKLPKKKVEEVFGPMEEGEAIRLHTGYNFLSREFDYLYSNKGLDIDNSRTFVSYPDNNVVKVSIIKPISLKAPYPTIVYYCHRNHTSQLRYPTLNLGSLLSNP